MPALTIAAIAAATVAVALVVRLLRRRSDERLQWQATRQHDWTTDELRALAVADGDLAEAVA